MPDEDYVYAACIHGMTGTWRLARLDSSTTSSSRRGARKRTPSCSGWPVGPDALPSPDSSTRLVMYYKYFTVLLKFYHRYLGLVAVDFLSCLMLSEICKSTAWTRTDQGTRLVFFFFLRTGTRLVKTVKLEACMAVGPWHKWIELLLQWMLLLGKEWPMQSIQLR